MLPWRAGAEGVTLQVRVTPRGGRDAVDGIAVLADGRAVMKLRVRAAAESGEANAAVLALLAKALRLPRADVVLGHGAAGRNKSLLLRGEAAMIAERLAALVRDGTLR